MLTASPITRQTVGRTFSIAISTLGVGAIFQLGIIGWAFATKTNNPTLVEPTTDATMVARINPPAIPRPEAEPDFRANPFAEPPQTLTTTPAASTPSKPTPIPQRTPTPEPTNRVEELIQQGKLLRERGDVASAITKFKESNAMDPKSPVPLAELAMTFEKMGNLEKAAEHWRRVLELGDTAGLYYTLADTKIKAAQSAAMREATGRAPATTDAPPPSDPLAPIEGIAAGATLGLQPIRIDNEGDDGRHFILHIPIKARPRIKMEVRDLVIHVLFYDIVDGQNVVQTSADVNSRWMSPPADWSEGDLEELAVEYQLPKPEAKAAKRENRKYFGYIVRIYYKQQLQAATAEPERLSQQYPPPPTLPKDTDK